jgi:hypothetical protein
VQLLLKDEVKEVQEAEEKRPARLPAFLFSKELEESGDQREAAM